MGFEVRKSSAVLVEPAEKTPSVNLSLSSIDKTSAVRVLVDLIFVFEYGDEYCAKVIKNALSKALVHYYPVAGRLVVVDDVGEPEVACTAQGVWFAEASMDCSLKDVNHLQLPLMVSKDVLLPCPPTQVKQEDCMFMMQVTQFTCQGFTVGIRFNHSVFDGLGAAQFVKAIGDIARGLEQPIVKPVWCREAIPIPAKFPHPQGPPPSFNTFKFETSIHDVNVDTINQIKNLYIKETGQRCSTFDVITAIFWQCRTQAISTCVDHETEVRLGFAANVRHLLHQVLPKGGGYYGNCVYPMAVAASSKTLMDGSVIEVVNLIKKGKEVMSTKFLDWMMGDLKEDPYNVPLDYGTCVVSDWSRVGFTEVDYGWGEPIHVAPLNDNTNFVASCIFLKTPAPKQGVRFLTRCVVKDDLQAFDEQMMKLLELYPSVPSENNSLVVSSS